MRANVLARVVIMPDGKTLQMRLMPDDAPLFRMPVLIPPFTKERIVEAFMSVDIEAIVIEAKAPAIPKIGLMELEEQLDLRARLMAELGDLESEIRGLRAENDRCCRTLRGGALGANLERAIVVRRRMRQIHETLRRMKESRNLRAKEKTVADRDKFVDAAKHLLPNDKYVEIWEAVRKAER